jgi:hypothetical protein
MSDDLTMDAFLEPPTPEEKARMAAIAEIKEEIGKFRNEAQADIRKLKKARKTENQPSKQQALDQQIAAMQKDFNEVDSVFMGPEAPRHSHFKQLLKWDEIMRKRGVAGY